MPLSMEAAEWFRDDERAALGWLRRACESARDVLEREACAVFPATRRGPELDRLWDNLRRALEGDTDSLRLQLSTLGARAACLGIELRVISEATQVVRRRLVAELIEEYGGEPALLESVLNAMQRVFDRGLWAVTREYLSYREALMEDQRRSEAREHQRAERMRLRAVELEAENRRVREVSRLKSEFLANMSHELRTPLNSIIGFADLLHDDEIPPAHQRELLADILRSARHLLKLINDVLDLAKVEAGKLEFCPEEHTLLPVINEVADALRPQATLGGVQLRVDVAVLDIVWIDSARLRQVLYNFLSNAIKFTLPGGKVRVRAFLDAEHWLTLEVEDDGVGISPQNLSRLFSEFEQLGSNRGGSGLGLALTRRIVETQGGTVGVRSEIGEGSTFWARLPAAIPADRLARPSSYFEQLRPSHVSDGTEELASQQLQRRGA